MNKRLTTTALALAVSLASFGALADADVHSSTFTGSTKDAWLMGKIETELALNGELSSYAINTDVNDGVVRLTGIVGSDIDRDLAAEIVKGIDGVIKVDNDLAVDTVRDASAETSTPGRRDFGSWVDDTTTTAVIKTRLLGNANTSGLKIDVDTADDVVTLSGRVESDAEKQLAEEIAKNTGDVEFVRNHLVIDAS